ncbi:MAG: UDP-N-acetylglucosamine 2-epimerase (non-hydrolyzing) [Candidatus Cloacimonetes bacterium]|nr:UDP-N-acetylglucosamine 2-epimerase (non-hydrolyzing) [Candidatus Cloacimonadota bacterium]
MKKIQLIVGARPNFMKIAPLYRELEKKKDIFKVSLIHTGQHYDEKMSELFFDDLEMPKPDVYLNVGSGTHGEQTARIIERYEEFILSSTPPDLVVVAGDVNSTFACALVAKKLCIPVAHLEAGLRSYDERMPEEINRVLTDRISDILLTPSIDANKNLEKEGIDPKKIFFVGNIMIDSLVEQLEKAKKSKIKKTLGLDNDEQYILTTLHRPSNVDEREGLKTILYAFAEIGKSIKIIFPMHPRTQKNIDRLGLAEMVENTPGLLISEPIGYHDFIKMEMEASLVLTDSGGIQEETTYFGIPCLTLRENTERPITITQGTNQLVQLDTESIVNATLDVLKRKRKKRTVPKFWDGKTGERVVEVIVRYFDEEKSSY